MRPFNGRVEAPTGMSGEPFFDAPQPSVSSTVTAAAAMFLGLGLASVRIWTVNRQADLAALVTSLATSDAETGLLNRHGVALELPLLVANARRLGTPIAVTYLDIDGLKAANDTKGHAFGDAMIRQVGGAIKESVRADAIAARMGGDEFMIVSIGTVEDHAVLKERVLDNLNRRSHEPDAAPVSISLGSASGFMEGRTADELIHLADEDLYRRRAEARA
ncbi:MAG: GGDEF domain-containing protein [Candidatus Nanopelagicales bacterium]|nr:GGDEF domain-containing protein [Candidatus Nanopelagicales bacterium]MCF8538263.1 GGDEF domain-containing protein [Candidatus Nanopelagicales bacterium]MCF8541910.1 GGDEF domain-containing protein [Candidatus Nanopelagicales bacterium]MCF8556626.1 GGDEF domain-containing protein [Candidatus Nanopelagicales bacterium]